MEEIAKIITAISDVTGLDHLGIIYGRNDECKKARGILCYIALKDKYGLTMALAEMLGKSRSQCTFAAEIFKEEMEESVGYLILMNEVRKKLGLSAIMTDKIDKLRTKKELEIIEENKIRSKANCKTIFGIEYSNSEESRLSQAIFDAKEFMREYTKIGKQADGRITRSQY